MENGFPPGPGIPFPGPRRAVLAATLLTILPVLVFFQTSRHPFAGFDDQLYVTGNPFVKSGITWASLRWAFTTFHAANWHPLTWFSHMIDVELFGLDPGPHHMVNLAIHILNTLLLFLLLLRMTRQTWRSALVAGLFAVHPLHVESVAWIAERKDLLSALFGFLALHGYASYLAKPAWTRYLAMAGFLSLSLLSKPMLVTFPFVLLLLDVWPLGRTRIALPEGGTSPTGNSAVTMSRLILEKVPLLALSLSSCIVTYIAQTQWGAAGLTEHYPIPLRLENALVSYATYIWKSVWPMDLSVFYPHPGAGIPAWKSVSAGILLAGATWMVLRRMKRHTYLATGWFWYLGTLTPVIGIIQVGGQAMADRYTYIPAVGLFILLAWGIPDILPKRQPAHRVKMVAGCLLLAILTWTSWRQAGIWKTRIGLFQHSLSVTQGNFIMHNNLGIELAENGRFPEAFRHYQEALRLKPDYAEAYYNWGSDLEHIGRDTDAIRMFREAIRSKPDFIPAYLSIGRILLRHGSTAEALAYYREGLRRDPGNPILRQQLLLLAPGR